jgi:hypothetical protein
MTGAILVALCLGLLATTGGAPDFPRAFGDYLTAQESLRYLPPNMRSYELDRLGVLPRSCAPVLAESGGLRLVGKWGAGPSVKITGRDSLVFLSRGSQVAVINYADTANPRVLSYIEINGLVSRSVLVGDRLYIGSTGSDPKYIDVFDVTDPANPQRLGHLQTRLLDIDVVDTLVYTVAKDSLRVLNFADPANPRQLGACQDTGYTLSACNGYAYIADRWGLFVVDVRDPTNPHHEASWGSDVISVKARGNICCATLGNPNQPTYLKFYALDVTQPSSITPLGSLDSCGGYDISLEDSLALVSGYYTGGHEFRVLSIRDSVHPYGIGGCVTPGDGFGVWSNRATGTAFVADNMRGLALVNIGDLGNPTYDRLLLAAAYSEDVVVQGDYAYVGNQGFGLKVLDISSPALPFEVGSLDTGYGMSTYSVAVQDSFAYMVWSPNRPWLRSIDVTDPTVPMKAGGVSTFDFARDMIVRDTFLYLAEPYRFQIVNVARPREPVLVGSCNLSATGRNVALRDAVAYVTMGSSGLVCIDISAPESPVVIGSWGGRSSGVSLSDTIAYVAGPYTGLVSLSVADPSSPRVIDSLYLTDTLWWNDVAIDGALACVGGERVLTVDVSDPANLRVLGSWTPPYLVQRLAYSPPYLYAACLEAGVCILESTAVGVDEKAPRSPSPAMLLRVEPNPAHSVVQLTGVTGTSNVGVFNAIGQDVTKRVRFAGDAGPMRMGIEKLPRGLYFVFEGDKEVRNVVKLVKQ